MEENNKEQTEEFVNPFPKKFPKPVKWQGLIPWEEYITKKYREYRQASYEGNMIYHYGVVKCHGRKKYEDIVLFQTKEEMEEFRAKAKTWNKRVKLAKRRNTEKKWEWLILSRPEYVDVHHKSTMMTNDIGQTVEVATNSEKWETLERIPIIMDMKFNVLGNNKVCYVYDEVRKTFVDLFVRNKEFVRVSRHKNKLFFEYDNEDALKVIVCGDTTEANMLLYHLMGDYRKCPYTLMTERMSERKKEILVEKASQLTGVDIKIIERPRTYK